MNTYRFLSGGLLLATLFLAMLGAVLAVPAATRADGADDPGRRVRPAPTDVEGDGS